MSNIYSKLADAREAFHKLELVKTGRNAFAGYNYFELGDFLIPAMECLKEAGLVTLPVSFNEEGAAMTVREIDGDGEFTFTSPHADANLKGCHPIQNLGAVETYQRRYLWVSLMEIVEHDALDATTGKDDEAPKPKAAPKKAAPKKATPKKATPPKAKVTPIKGKDNARPVEQKPVEDDFYCEDEEAAEEYANFMIKTATEMHSGSKETLVEFWRININAANYLKENFPDQYQTLLEAFGELKANLMEGDEE